jgi:hypothetical protein
MAKKTILFIDDDDDFRKTLVDILESESFNVLAKADASDVDKIASSKDIDAAIIDYHLPDIDGFTLADKIKQKKSHKFPIIILSSDVSIQNEAEKRFRHFISKPVDFSKFFKILEKSLN